VSRGYSEALVKEYVTARVVGPDDWTAIPAYLSYNAADPFAVAADLAGARWQLAREMLRDGLHRPVGIGDVRLWPCPPAAMFMHLRSPAGEALIELSYGQVAGFVSRTARLVPFGAEVMDLDGELAGGGW
jgi:hypothetical protein